MSWEILSVLGDGLVTIQIGSMGSQIWLRTSRRGSGKACLGCGESLEGKLSYRPAGNPHNRGDRICVNCMESKEKEMAEKKVESPAE